MPNPDASAPSVSATATPTTVSRRRFLGSALVAAPLLALPTTAAQRPTTSPSLNLGELTDSAARVIALDPRFEALVPKGAAITRLQTGSTWSEGPAWSAAGRYLVWSDVPNNRQWRWLEEDGHVSEFRNPSNNTNGSTFDAQGRMICCQQIGRRVVRFEADGSETVLANHIDGMPFNSPNDVVVHPDGSVWFTDPGYGVPKPLPQREAIYRIDPVKGETRRVDATLAKPNGLCFSPNFDRLYVADTGLGPDNALFEFTVTSDGGLKDSRSFARIEFNGLPAGPDGQQVDREGNVWASAGHGPDGVNGVHVFAPDGKLIGVILLPETCANVCFGGTGRNRLFMTATTSLYVIDTGTRGAHGS